MTNIDTPVSVGGQITGFRIGDGRVLIDLDGGDLLADVYAVGTFGDKEFSEIGRDEVPTRLPLELSRIVAEGIPLASLATLREKIEIAYQKKIQELLGA
jgi:hypothetical protein